MPPPNAPDRDAARLNWTHDCAGKCAAGPTRVHLGRTAGGTAVVWKVLGGREEATELHDRLAALGRAAPDTFCAPLAWAPADGDAPPLVGFPRYLGDLSERRPGEPAASDLALVAVIADLVAAVHAGRELHGDLKPANVLVDALRDGRAGRGLPVRLTDPALGGRGTRAWQRPWRYLEAPPSRADDEYALGWIVVTVLLPGAHPGDAAGRAITEGELAALRVRWEEHLPLAALDALDDWLRRADGLPTGPDAALGSPAAELAGILHRAVEAFGASGDDAPRVVRGAPAPGPASAPAQPPPPRPALPPRSRRGPVTALLAGVACWGQCAGPDGPPVDVYVPAQVGVGVGGSVGSPGRMAVDDDEDPRRVDLPAFLISATEVSQAEWTSLMGAPSTDALADTSGGCGSADGVSLVGDDLPAVCVRWTDALVVANRRSAREGLTPAYYADAACTVPFASDTPRAAAAYWRLDADGYRLPTEAEWETAARGDGAHDHLVGPRNGGEDANPCAYANLGQPGAGDELAPPLTCDDGYAGLAPVRSALPNGIGLFQIGGNVSEWVWTTDPRHGAMPEHRGGTWQSSTHERLSNRAWTYAGARLPILGMRLARLPHANAAVCREEGTPGPANTTE